MDRLGNGRMRDMAPYPDHPNELKHNRNTQPNGKLEPRPRAVRDVTAGRFQVLNTFIDFTISQLTRADMVAWLVLYRDSRNGVARTSQADIARRGGLSVRAVKLAITKLTGMGLLKVVDRGGLNKGASSYQVKPIPEPNTGEP